MPGIEPTSDGVPFNSRKTNMVRCAIWWEQSALLWLFESFDIEGRGRRFLCFQKTLEIIMKCPHCTCDQTDRGKDFQVEVYTCGTRREFGNGGDLLQSDQCSLLTMLRRFAVYGEQLWDDEDFRDGYKKISSGILVDSRKLLRRFGVSFEE